LRDDARQAHRRHARECKRDGRQRGQRIDANGMGIGAASTALDTVSTYVAATPRTSRASPSDTSIDKSAAARAHRRRCREALTVVAPVCTRTRSDKASLVAPSAVVTALLTMVFARVTWSGTSGLAAASDAVTGQEPPAPRAAQGELERA
jgi:hypothetical protein